MKDKYLNSDDRKAIAACIYNLRFDMDCICDDEFSMNTIMNTDDTTIIDYLMELLTELKESR